MRYVQSLRDIGLPVDRFGACFHNQHLYARMPLEERRSYKFYLSFENSHKCRDYLTEKFWRNALSRGLVPIVWGATRRDVAAVAPRGSYIHAHDFATRGQLVEHVRRVSLDDAAYRKFFDWRTDPEEAPKWRRLFRRLRGDTWCAHVLCDRLKEPGRMRRSVEDMKKFLYRKESDECMGRVR